MEDRPIWRYMSFGKFVSLLEQKALFFSRAELFSRDRFEGSISRANLAEPSELEPGVAEVIRALTSETLMRFKNYVMLSCWCIGEVESAGLWESYAPGSEGIAVKSTYNHLKSSFPTNLSAVIDKVTYLDYEKEKVPVDTVFGPFFCKRKYFEYEHELRAAVHVLSGQPGTIRERPSGAYVPVNLDVLVDFVCLAPGAPGWFGEVVQSVTAHYGLKKEVRPSGLSGEPVF